MNCNNWYYLEVGIQNFNPLWTRVTFKSRITIIRFIK